MNTQYDLHLIVKLSATNIAAMDSLKLAGKYSSKYCDQGSVHLTTVCVCGCHAVVVSCLKYIFMGNVIEAGFPSSHAVMSCSYIAIYYCIKNEKTKKLCELLILTLM
jgi:membrane-associated phospholipid phosphatase